LMFFSSVVEVMVEPAAPITVGLVVVLAVK
jgi:hypothetical protein